MLRAHTDWPARRMKRIAEAYEAARSHLVCDHTRDSPAHRLAADHEPSSSAQPRSHLAPRIEQHRFAIRSAATAALAPRPHVRKLETHDADTSFCEPFRDRIHERRIHRGARAMRQDDGCGRVLRPLDYQVAILHFPPSVEIRSLCPHGCTEPIRCILFDLWQRNRIVPRLALDRIGAPARTLTAAISAMSIIT